MEMGNSDCVSLVKYHINIYIQLKKVYYIKIMFDKYENIFILKTKIISKRRKIGVIEKGHNFNSMALFSIFGVTFNYCLNFNYFI